MSLSRNSELKITHRRCCEQFHEATIFCLPSYIWQMFYCSEGSVHLQQIFPLPCWGQFGLTLYYTMCGCCLVLNHHPPYVLFFFCFFFFGIVDFTKNRSFVQACLSEGFVLPAESPSLLWIFESCFIEWILFHQIKLYDCICSLDGSVCDVSLTELAFLASFVISSLSCS